MKYTISYNVEITTPEELAKLIKEIKSETGMEPVKITDENGNEISYPE